MELKILDPAALRELENVEGLIEQHDKTQLAVRDLHYRDRALTERAAQVLLEQGGLEFFSLNWGRMRRAHFSRSA